MTAQNYASRQMKEIAAAPDYALGSVHAITEDGELLIGSASGSQFATIAWGAQNVVLVAGLQKVVPALETARRRVREHSLPLEHLRAREAYGQDSRLGKTLEIYGEMPGRIHLVLIRQAIGTKPSRPRTHHTQSKERHWKSPYGSSRAPSLSFSAAPE